MARRVPGATEPRVPRKVLTDVARDSRLTLSEEERKQLTVLPHVAEVPHVHLGHDGSGSTAVSCTRARNTGSMHQQCSIMLDEYW